MSIKSVQLQVTMNAEGHIIAETYENGCRKQERIFSLPHLKEILSAQQAALISEQKKEEEKRIAAARARSREIAYGINGIAVKHGELFLDRVMAYAAERKNRNHQTPRQEVEKAKTVLTLALLESMDI